MSLNRCFRHCYLSLKRPPLYNSRYLPQCHYVTESDSSGVDKTSGGFAKAFEKYTKAVNETETPKEESFATLFRKSKFIDLGDPEGKTAIGTIFHIVNDDMYIDFGWKFYCVCPRPLKNGSDYVRGAKVRLSIRDLELSSKFLGSEKELTILEADAVLLGLVSKPSRSRLETSTVL